MNAVLSLEQRAALLKQSAEPAPEPLRRPLPPAEP
jgi:hypothetical protein